MRNKIAGYPSSEEELLMAKCKSKSLVELRTEADEPADRYLRALKDWFDRILRCVEQDDADCKYNKGAELIMKKAKKDIKNNQVNEKLLLEAQSCYFDALNAVRWEKSRKFKKTFRDKINCVSKYIINSIANMIIVNI